MAISESTFLSIYTEFKGIACDNPGIVATALAYADQMTDAAAYGGAIDFAQAAYAAQFLARSACGRSSGVWKVRRSLAAQA